MAATKFQKTWKENRHWLVLSMMPLPLRNASTECNFSMCGSLKPKSRNKMIVTALDALLTAKTTFLNQNECYFNF